MKTPTIYKGGKATIHLNSISPGVYLLVTVDSKSQRKSVWCESSGGAVDASVDIDEKMSLGACNLMLFKYENEVLKHSRNYYDAFAVGYRNSLMNGINSQLISLD